MIVGVRSVMCAFLLIVSSGCGFLSEPDRETFSGTLELTEHVLGAKVSGRVTTLAVDEGGKVHSGELIATLDRYAQSKKDYERATALFNQGGASRQAVEYAQLAMEDQMIVSPVTGVVLVKVHEAGEVVGSGSAVVVVGDMSRYWVRIFVPERFINRVRMGDLAKIKFDGSKDPVTGRVGFIASQAEFTPRNVQTAEERILQTFAVKIEISEPPDFLRPGVACDVTLDLRQERFK